LFAHALAHMVAAFPAELPCQSTAAHCRLGNGNNAVIIPFTMWH